MWRENILYHVFKFLRLQVYPGWCRQGVWKNKILIISRSDILIQVTIHSDIFLPSKP